MKLDQLALIVPNVMPNVNTALLALYSGQMRNPLVLSSAHRVQIADNKAESVLGSPTASDSLGILGRLNNAESTTSTIIPTLNLHDLELMMQWCNTTYISPSHEMKVPTKSGAMQCPRKPSLTHS